MRRHGRDLDRDELRAHVAALAADPAAWAHLVEHRADARVFKPLGLDAHVEAWLICWLPGHDTGFHDHDLSSGAVAVVAGAVREERLRFGAAPSSQVVRAGGTFSFGAADIHRVTHAGDAPAVSLHAYSPPLRRMGAYVVDDGGTLERHPLATGAELKPLVT